MAVQAMRSGLANEVRDLYARTGEGSSKNFVMT